jgi:hypothetical protein
VSYGPIASTPADLIGSSSENSLQFRIPRSQISLSFTDKHNPTVIDALSTAPTDFVPLPFNSGLYYQLSIVSPTQGAVSQNDFFSYSMNRNVSVFPVPSCAIATLTLFGLIGTSPVPFTAKAVPTELALPAEAGVAATGLLPIYSAKMQNNIFSTTQLNATYIDNTKIVSKIGSTVTDNTVTTLKDVTAVAAAILPLAALAAPPPPPLVPSPDSLVSVGTATVTVADNSLVDPTPIPSSGTIVMNSVCGASTTNSSSTSQLTQATTDIAAAISDAQQIYTAWGKSTK